MLIPLFYLLGCRFPLFHTCPETNPVLGEFDQLRTHLLVIEPLLLPKDTKNTETARSVAITVAAGIIDRLFGLKDSDNSEDRRQARELLRELSSVVGKNPELINQSFSPIFDPQTYTPFKALMDEQF